MDNRHWPYEPYDPYARRRPRDDGGWVVAGEEPEGWAPPPRNGQPPPRRRPRPPAGPPRDYGERPPVPRPGPRPYPDQAYPPPAYDPRPPPYPGAYPARRPAGPPPLLPAGEPEVEPRPALAPALSWTIGAYLVPMLLYLAWAFTRSGVAPADCVDASGAPCPPPRVEAAENLLSVLPSLVGALALALLIAVGLRRIATGWRSGSVGLAAAVIGAGFATVVTASLS